MKLHFTSLIGLEHSSNVRIIRSGNPTVLETTWAGGPTYFLYDDGRVSLQSENLPRIVLPGFGHNGNLEWEGT